MSGVLAPSAVREKLARMRAAAEAQAKLIRLEEQARPRDGGGYSRADAERLALAEDFDDMVALVDTIAAVIELSPRVEVLLGGGRR